MEKREVKNTEKIKKSRTGTALRVSDKRELIIRSLRALAFCVLGVLFGSAEMLFETAPLGFALLAASARQAPFVFLGLVIGSLSGAKYPLVHIVGALIVVLVRMFSRFFLDIGARKLQREAKGSIGALLADVFSEHIYLRMMSGAIGVFFVGVWYIIVGGFRFYDLFGAIFYLIATPVCALAFSAYFAVSEEKQKSKESFSLSVTQERYYNVSCALLVCALIYSLRGVSFAGVDVQLLVAVLASLYSLKKGVFFGVVASLAFGISVSTAASPMCALCAIAYASISKLSVFGAGVASCIAGVVWGLYTGGIAFLGGGFPALLCASMVFCTAERVGIFTDIETFLEAKKEGAVPVLDQTIIAEKRVDLQERRLRAISESFSSLSEIFYNLSSKLKRPTALDLRYICEQSFDDVCEGCENRELCFGAEYGSTLDVMKKMTVALHSSGVVQEKKLPESFKKRCKRASSLVGAANKLCAIETRRALQNEKTGVFALDYDAISRILNDAIAENEDEFKIDQSMSKKLSRVISESGFGDHSVSVFGKRKLKILARGLDLSERASDVTVLRARLEEATRMALAEPTFELSFGSVNMQTEARRAYSVDGAFATETGEGERMCGDTVSIFENKNDYLYALISDGMGKGQRAAFVSEMCNVFLRNMLDAGNRMETSLRMLNSVVREEGGTSEKECSATVDLLQFDMYSGALTLIKSGAAPTFVLRRGNVFKLGAPSFPIGILRALDAKQIDIACEDGDVVVMISDGATAEGDECAYLVDALKDARLADECASSIADKLLRRAKAEAASGGDDISVVVLKIKREVCNW